MENKKTLPKKKKNIYLEYAEAIVTALILALIIRAFIVQAFKIPSESMVPTLVVGDHLLVNKFLYGIDIPFTNAKYFAIRKPKQEDVIVFKYPKDPRRDFIKRVIAVEGDKVQGIEKKVYINDSPIDDERYVQYTDDDILPKSSQDPRDNFGPFIVPEGKVFVMGDNRDRSHDSRYWGYVDINQIRGKAIILYWSHDNNILHPRFGRIGQLIK
jgi:signal peptidase I